VVTQQIVLPKTLNVLITGVGAPGTRGTIFALKQNSDKVLIRIVGVDIKEDVIGKYWVDVFRTVPAPEVRSYINSLNEICEKESVDVVIPQTTRETAKLSKTIDKVVAKVAVSKSSAIARANNKYDLAKVCQRLGIPSPKSRLIESASELRSAAKDLGYPKNSVVVKPPVSFGSRGFRVLREGTSWDAERFLTEKPNATEITLDELVSILSRGNFPRLMVSEFLPGNEYSVDAFSGEKLSVAIPRLRKQIVNGISFRTSLEYRLDIMEYTIKAAKELGLRYAFGFQFKLDSNRVPKVLECNPRVQGTMAASVFSGVNVIWMAVREAIGKPVEAIPKDLSNSEFYRYWGGLGTCGDHYKEI
jgi:carbamoyl-phosphate synthase large subunit